MTTTNRSTRIDADHIPGAGKMVCDIIVGSFNFLYGKPLFLWLLYKADLEWNELPIFVFALKPK